MLHSHFRIFQDISGTWSCKWIFRFSESLQHHPHIWAQPGLFASSKRLSRSKRSESHCLNQGPTNLEQDTSYQIRHSSRWSRMKVGIIGPQYKGNPQQQDDGFLMKVSIRCWGFMFVSGVGAISYKAAPDLQQVPKKKIDGDHDHTQCVEAKQQLCYGFTVLNGGLTSKKSKGRPNHPIWKRVWFSKFFKTN